MKVVERRVSSLEEERVVFEYVQKTKELVDIIDYIEAKEKLVTVFGKKKEIKQIRVNDILYFEALGEHVYVQTRDQMYEVKMRLYQVEEMLAKHKMFRISKSVLINFRHVISVRPASNSRMYVKMSNEEELLISRKYARKVMDNIRRKISD